MWDCFNCTLTCNLLVPLIIRTMHAISNSSPNPSFHRAFIPLSRPGLHAVQCMSVPTCPTECQIRYNFSSHACQEADTLIATIGVLRTSVPPSYFSFSTSASCKLCSKPAFLVYLAWPQPHAYTKPTLTSKRTYTNNTHLKRNTHEWVCTPLLLLSGL